MKKNPFKFLASVSSPHLLKGATYASLGVALTLIILKSIAWFMTSSLSLQASLLDSILDMLASMINFIAIRTALQPPDYFHRFGHGKAEALAGLFQSLFIIGSGFWLIKEAVERLYIPEHMYTNGWSFLIMGVSTILPVLLVIYQGYVIKRTHSTAIKADRTHYYGDILANGSVIFSLILANVLVDAFIAVLIAFYLLKTSWDICHQAVNILMDHELSEKERNRIQRLLRSFPEVKKIKDLRTRSSGMKQFIQCQVVLNKDMSLHHVNQMIKSMEEKLIQVFPHAEIMIQPLADG